MNELKNSGVATMLQHGADATTEFKSRDAEPIATWY
jgi:hypothetical protein